MSHALVLSPGGHLFVGPDEQAEPKLSQIDATRLTEAFAFLKDIPLFEQSGVVVRIPDWWKAGRPPRPQVSVRIGEAGGNRLGADGLLDFKVSLIANWRAEIEKFATALSVFYAHPSETPAEELAVAGNAPAEALAGRDLVITSYSMAIRLAWLKEQEWNVVILDEAQAIKNPNARQSRVVSDIVLLNKGNRLNGVDCSDAVGSWVTLRIKHDIATVVEDGVEGERLRNFFKTSCRVV